MAGEWLKFEKATLDKPEVFAIAFELGIDPDAVIGKLMRVWAWFDTHTTNGDAARVTPASLDRIAGITGFVTAMANVGWMTVNQTGCGLPNFDRHCGETAKTRALGAKRNAAYRSRDASSVTNASPREEKRREEKEHKSKNKPSPAATALPAPPDGIDAEAWDGFVAMRKRIRFPMTTRAAGLIHKRLADFAAAGHDPNQSLDQSTRNGWRDVFEPKPDQGATHADRVQRSRVGLADRHPRPDEHHDAIPGTAVRVVAG